MTKQKYNYRWLTPAVVAVIGISVILQLAYTGGIPSWIAIIPYYDAIGHFVLYGAWSFVFYKLTNHRRVQNIPVAPVFISIITIAEEFGQNYSPNRTFSLTDLFLSLLGIWLAAVLADSHAAKRSDQPR